MKLFTAIKLFSVLGILLFGISEVCYGQNRVVSYIEMGSANTVNRFNYGMAAEAEIELSPQVRLLGGLRLANQYPSGLGDIKVGAKVYLRKNSTRWSCENVIDFSNYAPYPMNQLYYRLTFAWEGKHLRVDFGNSFAFFIGSGVTKYNLCRPSFCIKGNIWERDHAWNIEPFIRNFNRFEVHGSKCVEWGSEFSMSLAGRWKLFCEPYVKTAGNFNGTATFYNFNCNVGGVYTW